MPYWKKSELFCIDVGQRHLNLLWDPFTIGIMPFENSSIYLV
jgi:hypothetical protein